MSNHRHDHDDDHDGLDDRDPAPGAQPELVRPTGDRVIAGVAGAIARRLGLTTGWVRIGFVLLVLLGGLGLVAYAIGWLMIREEGRDQPLLDEWLGGIDGVTTWVGVGLVVLAGIVMLGITPGVVRSDLLVAAVLFVGGVLLYRGRLPWPPRPDRTDPRHGTGTDGDAHPRGPELQPEPGPEPDFPSGPADDPEPDPAPAATVPPVVATGEPPTPPGGGYRPRRPCHHWGRGDSYLGRLTGAAILITLAVMMVVDGLDLASPSAGHYLAAVLVVTGVGLVVGSLAGRARGLILVGLLLVPPTLVASAVDVDVFGEYGEEVVRPRSLAELEEGYELSGGRILLDLTAIEDSGAETVAVSAAVGMGEVEVRLPAGVDVGLDGRVGIGVIDVRTLDTPRHRAGFDLEVERSFPTDGDTEILLDLDVGLGVVEVDGR